jgi:TMEM175 potassium channel family protein
MLNTIRAEAFSDGVFAIAATLLVLELKVPHVELGGLSEALLERWPSYVTYVVSFLTIGIIWVNHHAVMKRIKNVNRPLLFLNLVFLMAVAALRFPDRPASRLSASRTRRTLGVGDLWRDDGSDGYSVRAYLGLRGL